MPTKKEAEEYKRMVEQMMLEIETSDLPDKVKDELLNLYIDKWKDANDALLGLGVPLED